MFENSRATNGDSMSTAQRVRLGGVAGLVSIRREVDEAPWYKSALCAETDPEIFFPAKGGSTKLAKKICGECTVRAECQSDILAVRDRHGVQGGMSEGQRRKLAKALAEEPDSNLLPE